MARTFGEITLEAGTLLNKTDPQMLTVLGESINRRYREILGADSWHELHREIDLTVPAGALSIGLPFEAEIVRSIYNKNSNQLIERIDPVEVDQRFGSIVDQAGGLRHYSLQGMRGSFANFQGTDPVTAASTDPSDSCEVRLTGFDGDGLPYETTATVVGTAPTIFSPAIQNLDGASVLNCTKNVDTVGTIQIVQFPGPGLVSVIASTERAARYTWVRFSTSADTDTQIRVNCIIYVPDLVNANDVPIIRAIEHILVVGAQADGYRFLREFQKATSEELRYRELVLDFRSKRSAEEEKTIQASGAMHRYRDLEVW